MFTTLTEIRCWRCDITFAVPEEWRQKRVESRDTFYCPLGHELSYKGENQAEKYKRLWEQEQEQKRLARLDFYTEKGKRERAERKLRRIDQGVCHKCNRSFTNLRRHMENHKQKAKGKTRT